ncbi:MAG: TIGR04255 family protein [Actinomycetota bacterium]|nr:TIGR04255 family protein [Actinomycetota bacterium]
MPDYRRPPIDEVAIGVQFPVIPGFFDAHVGILWQSLRSTYPRVESHPRQEPPVEAFSPNEGVLTAMQLQLISSQQVQGRTWLISADDSSLIQVQNTRFVHNWRHREGEYPHFDDIFAAFSDEYDSFSRMLASEGLAQPQIEQLELTYINWIEELTSAQFFRPAEVAKVATPGVGPNPEDQTWLARYLARDGETPIGRLYVQCEPAVRVGPGPPSPGTQLALIYRRPISGFGNPSEMLEHFEFGREAIVRTFTDLTTAEAHATWERFQ